MQKTVKLWFIATLLMVLNACGGGGSISRDSTTPGTDDGAPSTTFSLSMSIAERVSGNDNNQLSADTPLTISTRVVDGDGQPVAGQLVTYSFSVADLASFDPEAGTALTDSNGVSRINLVVGQVAGDGLVTARLESGETAEIGFSSSGDGSTGQTTLSISLVSRSSGETNSDLRASNPLRAIVQVTGADGNPSTDTLVSFTLSQEGLALFEPENGAALTNSAGVASIDLLVGNQAGAGVLTATLNSGETVNVGFTSAGDGGVSTNNLSLAIASRDSGEASTELSLANPLRITATLTDANGQPVNGELVSFSFNQTGLAVFDPQNGAAITNEQGVATIDLLVGAEAGAGVVTATLANDETAQIGFNSAGDASNSLTTISLSIADRDSGDPGNEVSAANPLRVTALVLDGSGTPRADALVSFSFSEAGLALFDPANGAALTNAQGIATIDVVVGTQAGAGQIVAALATGESASVGFTSQGDGSVSQTTVVLSIANRDTGAQGNEVSAATPLRVTAVVTNADGSPQADQLVTFNFSEDGLATFDPSNGAALTNAQGIATIDVIVGTQAGAGQIVGALETGESGSVGFTSVGDGGATAINIALSIANRDTGDTGNEVSASTPLRVTAVVSNPDGSPRADELITFTFSEAGLASFDPANGAALTNSQGIATIDVIVGDQAGAGLIVATLATEENASIGFSSTGDGGTSITNVSLSIASRDTGASSNELSASNPLRITATVTNADGTPRADELVTFTFNQTGLAIFDPTNGTALSNSSGVATIDLLVGEQTGAGIVTATLASGDTAQIGFESQGDGGVGLNTITMAIANLNDGVANNELSTLNPLQISATITDANGQPVVDELVTFSFNQTGLATFNPANGTALTNSSGVAQIRIDATSQAGAGFVIATIASGETNQIGFNSIGDAGESQINVVMSIVSQVNGQQTNQVSSSNPLVVTATLTNGLGNPVTDTLVTFTFNQDGLAIFDPSNGTALSDSTGAASITLLAGEQAGAGVVTATLSSGETGQIGFVSTGDGNTNTTQPASLELFASSTQLSSSGSDQVELIALAKNAQNILLEGVVVSFAADSGELQISQGTTGADGTARAILTSRNNSENRTVVASAEAGSLSENLSIAVVGTTVQVNGPVSVIINDTAELTITVNDSDGNGIANQLVSVASANGNTLNATSLTTDQTGQVVVDFTAINSGTDVVTVTALNATGTANISVQQDQFSFSTLPSEDVPLNSNADLVVTWLRDGSPFVGGNVTFSSTRGTLSSGSGVTDAQGQVALQISSSNAGAATLLAQGTDSDGEVVNSSASIEFVATQVDAILIEASPNSIGPDGQKSTITAVLRDPAGNLVKSKTVNFTAQDVSGGSISPAVAVTDSNGRASTVFTSNTVTPQDAIVITATEVESGIQASTSLTVADRALFISLGTGNVVEIPDDATYLKRFSVFVTDANSNPVDNVDLTVSGIPVSFTELLDPNASVGDPNFGVTRPAFYKGTWEPFPNIDAFEFWVSTDVIGCPNEDIDGDAILDPGEDANGDGQITPGNIVAIDGNVTTDANGQAIIAMRYPKTFAAWVDVNVTVSAVVAGSESRASLFFRLEAASSDLGDQSSTPNSPPFGSGVNLVDDPANPGSQIDDGSARTCSNLL